MKSTDSRSARRALQLSAFALVIALATCVEPPTSSKLPDAVPTAGLDLTALAADPIAHALLTSGNGTANQRAFSTASISPAPNALVTIAVLGHRSYGANPSPVVSGGGMAAWEEVGTVTFDPTGDPLKRITVYRAMSPSPGSGPITITFENSVSNAQWIVSQWVGVDVSGTNGAGAVVQTGSARADAASGLTVSLAPFSDVNNIAYGIFAVKRNVLAITPGAGFTKIDEIPSVESPHSSLATEWASNDNTVDASWAALNGAALALEIRAAVGGGDPPPPPPPPPALSPSLSTVAAEPTSIVAGAGPSTITVTVKDVAGNPVSGATVAITVSGTGNAVTQPSGPTDASGIATGSFTSTVAESKTISATANGTALTQTATVGVTAPPDEPPPPPSTTHPLTQTLLTAGNNTANQSVYTTQPISPAPNTLITVAVMGHNSSSAAPSPTLSGGGMPAWTEVATVAFDPISGSLKRMSIFRAMSATPGSGPITIRFSKSQSNAQWMVSQWEGVDISGVNGAGAIVQSGSSRANAANGLTVALAPFGNENNAAYGVFGVKRNAATITPGAGFTEISEQPSAESPHSSLQAQWASDDNTVDATWTNLNGGALAVEIKAGSHGGPQAPVVSVNVTPTSASVLVGGTVQLTATALDAEDELLTGRSFTWTSDAPNVASVTATGVVRGEGAGIATITATSEGKSGMSNLTVTVNTTPVASVEITPASANVNVGGMLQLTATAEDAAGQPLSGRSFAWTTSAPGVATVSSTGVVTGNAEGSATITATSEGKSGTSTVMVHPSGQSALMGQWSSVMPAPIVFVHVHLLRDGRVLAFGKDGDPQVWNPATGSFTAVPSPSLVFCSGHDFLPDGNLLVAGGHISSSRGLANTNTFDVGTSSWVVGPMMAKARWYPTNTTLPNGEVVTISGVDENGKTVLLPEIWNGSSWRQLTTASLALPNYPRTFVAPDGRIFYAGSDNQTRYLDVSGTGSWTNGPQRLFGGRSYGSAVMYEPGKIMYVGGSNPPTATAEIIDLNQSNPQWTYTGSLTTARWNLNATILPTGEVLATAGVSGDRSNPALAVNTTELWSPVTGSWTTVAPSASMLRGYHSSSLLLPDGRVLHAGGGDGASTPDNLNYELYSPPYLFRGARPVIAGSTPSEVTYGQSLTLGTPDAARIAKVNLIRFGSVTHAFDAGSRLVPLAFRQVAGGIDVTIPASRATAPPGPYMLFILDGNGVPSVARIMLVR